MMHGFWPVFKVSFVNLFGINKKLYGKDKKGKAKIGGIIAVLSIVALGLAGLSASYTFIFCMAMIETGEDLRRTVAIMFTAVSLFLLFYSIHSASGEIFGFKDYEILSALPIKQHVILLAKVSSLYIFSIIIFFLVVFPSIGVYQIVSAGSSAFIGFRLAVMLPFMPMAPMFVGLGVGVLLNLLTSKIKRKNLINTILYVLIFVLYFAFVFGLSRNSAEFVSSAYKVYPLNFVFVSAICDGNILMLLAFTLGSLLLFAGLVYILAENYRKINALSQNLGSKTKNKTYTDGQKSVGRSLYKRNVKRLFSSSMVAMNVIGGAFIFAILIIGFAIMFLFNENVEILDVPIRIFNASFTPRYLMNGVVPLLAIPLSSGCTFTSVCISLEGKSFWILKSSPVRAKDEFKAKILVDLTFSVPISVISVVAVCIMYKLSVWALVFSVLISCFYSLANAESGLLLNLRFPSLDWETEAEAVKRGTSPMIHSLVGIFGGFLLIFIQVLFSLINLYLGLALVLVATIASIFVFSALLRKWGERKYLSL